VRWWSRCCDAEESRWDCASIPRNLCTEDLCTELISREVGVAVTDARGQRLIHLLDCTSNVSWIGYANPAIRQQAEPTLRAA
jgi:4-aminobutyrate aminotransferase-like enzyme